MDVSPLSSKFWSGIWSFYRENREPIVTLLTVIGGAVTAVATAWFTLRQARAARERDTEQANADRQRAIIEDINTAIEQLGNDRIQVRLGGIYALERISRESESDYWPIMEILTGFVREHARWKGEDTTSSQTVAHMDQLEAPQQSNLRPPADIAAVLTVIMRRDAENRKREQSEVREFNLTSADLRGAALQYAHLEGVRLHETHLEGANLHGAHLEKAWLHGAHLEGATLHKAHLERANLSGAHLEGAWLFEAHLEGGDFFEAHLEGARLQYAHLEGATFIGAHLEGANLRNAKGLTQDQLTMTYGNAETQIPEGLTRPAHWLSSASTK
jgi:uncharacterized protein YjbI with pentapeptide repeats